MLYVNKIFAYGKPRTLRRIGMVDEKCGLTVLVLVNAQSILHIVFQLYDVLRFDSTVVINVLINIPSPKLKKTFFFISKLSVHEYSSALTSTAKVLFCRCNIILQLQRQKIYRSKKVKICKL